MEKIIILLFIIKLTTTETVIETPCKRTIGKLNTTYTGFATNGENLIYTIPLDPMFIRDPFQTTLRLEASINQNAVSDLMCPLLFTIAQSQEIVTFKLPFIFKTKPTIGSSVNHYYSAARTLCVPEEYSQLARNITVRVSTCSTQKINFRFRVNLNQEQLEADGPPVQLDVTPTTPQYYKYKFKNGERIIRILVTSEDKSCATVSVQGPYCPVYDQESNIAFDGFWQTMSTKAALTISKKDFPEGFVIVIVHHRDDNKCSAPNPTRPMFVAASSSKQRRLKPMEISLRVERQISGGFFVLAMLIPVLGSVLLIALTCCLFSNRHSWLSKLASSTFHTPSNGKEMNLLITRDMAEDGTSAEQINLENQTKPVTKLYSYTSTIMISTLQKKQQHEIMKDSNRFYWTIIIVSIFYTIPVYQLILHYLRVVNQTGEFDICYYNFLCSHRLWIFTDFNHFWSNISYIIFGISFNFIVGRRERNLRIAPIEEQKGCFQFGSVIPECMVKSCCSPIINTKLNYGIPHHFGVFYAMGLALVMEGVLSAAYHLCPNQSNFQFDTCFMYVIAVLTILKVYQFRHPVHIGANQTFAILAAFAFISVIGLILEIYDGGSLASIFRWTFIIFQLVSMILISVHYYSIGFIKDGSNSNITGWNLFLNLNQLPRTIQLDRLVLPVISFTLSSAVVIYCELNRIHFATYLLYTLIANVFASFIYYIGIMKPLHREFKNYTWVQPLIYFTMSILLGTISIQYFLNALTAWETSPSESRAINAECSASWFPFYPFYDNHDIWHFFSAAGLFFAFMGLLIVDDDLLTTPQAKIPIF